MSVYTTIILEGGHGDPVALRRKGKLWLELGSIHHCVALGEAEGRVLLVALARELGEQLVSLCSAEELERALVARVAEGPDSPFPFLPDALAEDRRVFVREDGDAPESGVVED